MRKCCVLFVFTSLFYFGIGGKLPSTFKICKRSDPDPEDCFTKAIQQALPYLKEPIPELGLPSIDPVKIDSILIAGGSSSSVNLTQKLSNIELFNVIDSTITKTELNLGSKEVKLVVHVFNKLIKLEYDYETEGKILLIPISGKGKAYTEMYDIKVPVTVSGVFHEKKGKTYVKVTDVTVDLIPVGVKFNLENLFNGDERLGREMNKLLNENWKDILDDFKPGYSQGVAAYFKSVFAAIFDRVPYDELFPL